MEYTIQLHESSRPNMHWRVVFGLSLRSTYGFIYLFTDAHYSCYFVFCCCCRLVTFVVCVQVGGGGGGGGGGGLG